jgi:hypothetical protein
MCITAFFEGIALLDARISLRRTSSSPPLTFSGILVEHWDVIQDEATREQSKSGQPMFGDKFGS